MSNKNNSFTAANEDKNGAKKSNQQQPQFDANNSHSGSICLSNNLFDSSFASHTAEAADGVTIGSTFGPQQHPQKDKPAFSTLDSPSPLLGSSGQNFFNQQAPPTGAAKPFDLKHASNAKKVTACSSLFSGPSAATAAAAATKEHMMSSNNSLYHSSPCLKKVLSEQFLHQLKQKTDVDQIKLKLQELQDKCQYLDNGLKQ